MDIRFDQHLPPIYSVLRAGDNRRIVIEVLARRDVHRDRADSGPVQPDGRPATASFATGTLQGTKSTSGQAIHGFLANPETTGVQM